MEPNMFQWKSSRLFYPSIFALWRSDGSFGAVAKAPGAKEISKSYQYGSKCNRNKCKNIIFVMCGYRN
jgi:hypothetical protein